MSKQENVCYSITTRDRLKRRMKESLFTRDRNTVEPFMIANDNRKRTFHAIHNDTVINSSYNFDLDIAHSWAPTRVGSRRMISSSRLGRLRQYTTLRQLSFRLTDSFGGTDTGGVMEKTNGRHSGTQLSRSRLR